LTNFYAVTHPSEPNYAAVAGGDYFGIGDDALHNIPSQVATVVDILEEKGGPSIRKTCHILGSQVSITPIPPITTSIMYENIIHWYFYRLAH
jgi:hypothetical protein